MANLPFKDSAANRVALRRSAMLQFTLHDHWVTERTGGKEDRSFLELPSPPVYSNAHKPRLHQSALRLSSPDSDMYGGAVVLETPGPEVAQAFTTRYNCQPLALISLSKSKA